MADYVPTTDVVRRRASHDAARFGFLQELDFEGQFDRWLADVIRYAKVEALGHVATIIEAAAEVVNSSAWRGAYRNCAEQIREYARASSPSESEA